MREPKVSVVITSYNRADYLGYAIESVLKQTYRNFELIIIDDGSTDNTIDVVQKFNDSRLRYHYQKNQGQNPSRNQGMYLSRGEFIAHLDSDDMWKPTKLEKQVEILDKYPDIGLVYCGTELIDKNNKYTGFRPIAALNGYVLKELLLSNFLYNGSNTLFRKKCLEKVGYFDKQFWRMTDWEFYLRFAIYYNFYSVSEHLLQYRIHEDTMSYDFKSYEDNGLNIIKSIFSNPGFPEKYKYLKAKAVACRHRYMARRYYENNFKKETLKYLLKTIFTDGSMMVNPSIIKLFILTAMPQKVIKTIKSLRDSHLSEGSVWSR